MAAKLRRHDRSAGTRHRVEHAGWSPTGQFIPDYFRRHASGERVDRSDEFHLKHLRRRKFRKQVEVMGGLAVNLTTMADFAALAQLEIQPGYARVAVAVSWPGCPSRMLRDAEAA